jgi:hypothetical protein
MKRSATPPALELTLSALLREVFAEHADDRTVLPVHLAAGRSGPGDAGLGSTSRGTLRYHPLADPLP